ncbi:MAG: beta-lactamase family protein [Kutzneria sp.]|nr:beta-lactamase family protein [Kutzneria sp.]MBV9845536.1 beta-lactamase family protein [Kutzneria sp.]
MSVVDRRGFLGACGVAVGASLLSARVGWAAPAPGADGSKDLAELVHGYLNRGLELGYPGLVCGVVQGGRDYAAGVGRMAGEGSPTPDDRTLFQMGSVTKTVTALALAEAQVAGRLRIDDPLARHLPASWRVPYRGPRPIALADLATHTAGLPPLPPNLTNVPDFNPLNPYAHYTRDDLAEGLCDTVLDNDPGTHYAYSNYGFALLGQVLGGVFEPILRDITLPLGMIDTTTRPTVLQRNRKATGHNEHGVAVPDWTGAVFDAAGDSAFSTVRDLLAYLRAQLTPEHTVFARAIRETHRPRFTVTTKVRVGLGWHISPLPNTHTMVWHNGGTGGFSSFLAFSNDSDTAVVLMTNCYVPDNANTGRGIDALGVRLLTELDTRRAGDRR